MQSTGGSDVGGLENASLSNLGLNEADSLAISNEEVRWENILPLFILLEHKATLSEWSVQHLDMSG